MAHSGRIFLMITEWVYMLQLCFSYNNNVSLYVYVVYFVIIELVFVNGVQ